MELFGSSPAGKVKRAARLLADARPLMDKDIISARRKLEESLALLQPLSPETQARTGTLTVTLLALARIERLANNSSRAVQLLEQALDLRTGLSDDDRNYLVIEYARAERTDARAIDQYLAYISFRTLDPSAGPSGLVYDLLDRSCRLDDDTPAEEVPARLALCTRIIAADGRLGLPYYYRGTQAFATGNYAAAIADFKQASERGVSHPHLAYCLHLCSAYRCKNENSLDHAAHHFVEAARQNPSCFAANFEAGQCLIELYSRDAKANTLPENVAASRRAYAIALLERACQIDFRSAAAHFALGQAYNLDRNSERAREVLLSAANLQPCAAYFYEYARTLRRCGALQEAVAAADRALKLDPGHIMAQWLASSVSLQIREFDRARSGFRKLIANLPPEHKIHRNALYGSGVCAFEVGNYPGAIDSLRSLQAQELELTPEGRLMLARSYLRTGELAQSEELLRDLAAAGENRAAAFYYLGCCKAREGHYECALTALTDAENAGASQFKCLLQRGMVHEAMGQADAARHDYCAALEISEAPEIRYRLGLACWKEGRYDEALTHLRQAEQRPEVLAAQAELHELIGDKSESLRLFQAALASAPNEIDIRRRFAASIVRARDAKLASEALNGAAKTPEDGLIPFEFGLVRLLAGDPDGAIDVLARSGSSPQVDTAIGIAALYASRKAHESGDYDRSLVHWNHAARLGLEDERQKKQRAVAVAASAIRSAASGASADHWTQLLRTAAELDPDNDAIKLLTAASELAKGAGCDTTELERIVAAGIPEHRCVAAYLLGIKKLLEQDAIVALFHLRTALCEGSEPIKHAARIPYAYALAQSGRFSEAADLLGGSVEY